MKPLFLALDEVLEIHALQIELYGGSDAVRDPAGLESAVATPMATFGGQFLHSTIPSMAAAYLFHICQNHAFVDGNKRTGANAAITFLLINDWDLDVSEDALVDLVLSVASGFTRRSRRHHRACARSNLRGYATEAESYRLHVGRADTA